MGRDGFARGVCPVHTRLDGDTVFATATGARPLANPVTDVTEIGAVAANVLARAIARGVYEARALPFAGAKPDWKSRFGGG
jgi:L-aminopeptidase/D-esterase-like protein